MSEIRFPDFAIISLTYDQRYSVEVFLLAHGIPYDRMYNKYGATNGIRIKGVTCTTVGEIMTRFDEIKQ